MERSFVVYQSLYSDPKAVVIGCSDSAGHEIPETRYHLNVTAVPVIDGQLTGEPVELTVSLTVGQMAQVIKTFFAEVIRGGVCRRFFRRLLTKRWAVMTDPLAKDPRVDHEWYDQMSYHRTI